MTVVVDYVISSKPTWEAALVHYPDDPTKAQYWHKIATRVWIRTRAAEAQNWRCCWCGHKMCEEPGRRDSVTREHVTPRSLGGNDGYGNIAAACARCNRKRGILDINVFMGMVQRNGWVQGKMV